MTNQILLRSLWLCACTNHYPLFYGGFFFILFLSLGIVWFYSISITIIIIIISCYLFLSFSPFVLLASSRLGRFVYGGGLCVYMYKCVCVGVVLVIGASPSPGSPIPTASHPTPAILITVIHRQKKSTEW